MNSQANRPTTPTLCRSPSAKPPTSLTPKALHNKENAYREIALRPKAPEELPFESSVAVEGNYKKVTTSKVLTGRSLQEATQRQLQANQKERAKVQPALLRLDSPLPNGEPIKTSSKRSGPIVSYAACTNRGLVRTYNEDRVSIILSLGKDKQLPSPAYFFGLYDGHGGAGCCDFLRDNLHNLVSRQAEFPDNPVEALRKGIKQAELAFLEHCENSEQRSGSTLLAALLVGGKCYLANVGDCRAVLSSGRGKSFTNLTRDHKPCDEGEQVRIERAGGKIFQTTSQVLDKSNSRVVSEAVGPLRVFPGRLSVSRTVGDPEAKLERLGGSPGVVISEPEITVFELSKEHDFILMCTDGIFDKMGSGDAIEAAWRPARGESFSAHQFSGRAVENVVREAMNRQSADNLSAVLVGLSGLEQEERALPKSKTLTGGEMKSFLREGKGRGLR